jgi:preprotein translocase subunit SecA
MAIVDEVDSVLIDEASVPFILSRAEDHRGKREHYARALELARGLVPGEDFTLDPASHAVELTARGRARTEPQPEQLDPLWRVQRFREEALCLALAALHLFHRDRHYLVRGGAVHIIDDTSGRVAAGRAWSRGLHQLIELKESCKPSAELVTAAQITYQRFFSRYLHLCGMSGTLLEGRAELRKIYGVPVVRVPLRKASRRVVLPTRVFRTHEARWEFVVLRAQEIQARGGAVLIGTDSVADSQALSQRLDAAGLAHVVLNARQDRHEAHVIATAGQPGRITVATSMAGRGTDIALSEDVARNGGLHVVLCQANASRRIDRQFTGRAARRGEPGSCETLLSLESPPMLAHLRHGSSVGRGAPSKSGRAGWESRSRAYHCGSRNADATGFAGSCKCRSTLPNEQLQDSEGRPDCAREHSEHVGHGSAAARLPDRAASSDRRRQFRHRRG